MSCLAAPTSRSSASPTWRDRSAFSASRPCAWPTIAELLLARLRGCSRSLGEAAELLDPLEQARPELGIELAGQRFRAWRASGAAGTRAAAGPPGSRRRGRLEQGVVDRRELDLGLLLRHEGRDLVGELAGGGAGRVRSSSAGIADRAPLLGELGIHDQDAGRDQPLGGDVGAGQPAEQLFLALGRPRARPATRPSSASRFRCRPVDERLDGGQRVGAMRRCPAAPPAARRRRSTSAAIVWPRPPGAASAVVAASSAGAAVTIRSA